MDNIFELTIRQEGGYFPTNINFSGKGLLFGQMIQVHAQAQVAVEESFRRFLTTVREQHGEEAVEGVIKDLNLMKTIMAASVRHGD
jgi:hypothetical protein